MSDTNPDISVTMETVGQGMGTGVRRTREFIWRNENRDVVQRLLGNWRAHPEALHPSILLAARIMLDGNWGFTDKTVEAEVIPRGEFSPGQMDDGVRLLWSHLGPLAAFAETDIETARRYVADWPTGVSVCIWREQCATAQGHGHIAVRRGAHDATLYQWPTYDKTPLIALEIAPAVHHLHRLIGQMRHETVECMRRGSAGARHAAEQRQRRESGFAARRAAKYGHVAPPQ